MLQDVMSSSVHRHRLVSWCVDSTPCQTTSDPHPSDAEPAPVLLLSPPETSGKLNNAAFSHKPMSTNQEAPSQIPLIQLNPEADGPTLEGLDEGFHLPRSSPVISRRHRPVSWIGGVDDSATASSPVSGFSCPSSDSLGPCERLIDDAVEDPSSSPVQENKQQHHPFRESQEVSGEHKGRSHTGSNNTSGFSFSTQRSQDRRSGSFPQFPADIFKSSCELEKENAHFVVVDMVLEVLEGVKWTKSFNRWFSNMNRKANIEERCGKPAWSSEGWKAGGAEKHKNTLRGGDFRTTYRKTQSSEGSGQHQHIQDEEEEEEEEWEPGNTEHEHQPKTFSVLSNDSGFEDYADSNLLTHRQTPISAEWLAQQLVLEFKRNWFPSRELRRDRLSLRSSLQELPGTRGVVCSGSLTEEIRLRTRMRGTLSWTPPCFQIISSVQPTHRRSAVVAFQQFLCAGCGTEVEPRYIKKLRYCEYLGRYFCDCCHSGSEAVIPGRVLSCWDFSRYPVSDFSKQLLDSVWHQPLFDLTCVGKTLYNQVKELNRFRDLQDQLMFIKKLLKACRLSAEVYKEFERLPAHLTEQLHLFSMDDLLKVKKGQLVVQARAMVQSAVQHVQNCQLCLARGFICEFCREKDIIFPFQSDICKRCPVCKACFHKHCFMEKKCPKCARIQTRRKRSDGPMK